MSRSLRLAAALMMVSLAPVATRSASAPVAVRIQGFAFSPATIRVTPGTVVEWVNEDDEPHTVTSDDDRFGSRALDKGSSFTSTFEREGRFAYHCALHPQMTGTVEVE